MDLALNIDEPVNTGQLTGHAMIETDTVKSIRATPAGRLRVVSRFQQKMRPIPLKVNNALYPLTCLSFHSLDNNYCAKG